MLTTKCRNLWFLHFTVNSIITRWLQLEKIYKQRQHACSSEDGKVCNNVSKIYRDACNSGGRERVVKGCFKTSGCHTGSRNMPQISKRFPKWGSKRTCERENSSPVVFFMINTDWAACRNIYRIWTRSHTYTLYLSIKVSQHCSQIRR